MPLGDGPNNWAVGNPFEEPRQRIAVYSAQEIATLQSRLDKQLGPEYISSRAGPGGKQVHYLASEKCINLANEVFGFNGWSSSVREVQVDFVDENTNSGKISMGLSVVVRVTLKDGAYHEDIGYGNIENCRDKAAAFEKAKKEAVSDGRKRALRNFGKLLGNCIYDKDYLAKVTKIKPEPKKFSVEELHRQPDHIYIKKEPLTQANPEMQVAKTSNESSGFDPDDEFGAVDFDEADFNVGNGDHPDEIGLDGRSAHLSRSTSPNKTMHIPAQRQGAPPNPQLNAPPLSRPPGAMVGPNAAPNKAPMGQGSPVGRGPQGPNANTPRPSPGFQGQAAPARGQFIPAQQHQPGMPLNSGQTAPRPSPPTNQPDPPIAFCEEPQCDVPVGFVTARAAESLQSGNKILPDNAAFNPRHESPSIKKTAGFDHSSSKPAYKASTAASPAPPNAAMSRPGANYVNPQLDPSRKLGMPGGVASPLQNRSSFRQPQMKRSADSAGIGRPALNDVTHNSVNVPTENGDNKRQKIGDTTAIQGGNGNAVNGS